MQGGLFDAVGEVEKPKVVKVKPGKPEPVVLSVSGLAAAVKDRLEGDFGRVVVQGELSGGKLHSSGHFYCDLKDDEALLNAVAWRGAVAKWSEIPANGTLVVATGKLTTYAKRSNYQLMIEKIELAGLGALMQQLEALKKRLLAEGLFDVAQKRALPFLPRRVGIITSPTGAVIGDMLHRIAARCPREVVLWPVAVQGTNAAMEVAAAIEGMNRLPEHVRPDVLIVARGGGSFEDLMPFNSEVVVRAVAGSAIVVVSGVGHEPDVTLCDLAADVRAPTPSAAAELVVPVRDDLLMGLAQVQARMVLRMRERLGVLGDRVMGLARLLPDPRRQVLQAGQRLGELDERLRLGAPRMVRQARERLLGLERVLLAQSPLLPLERGFVYLVRDGQMVRSAVAVAGPVEVRFKDGVREAVLT